MYNIICHIYIYTLHIIIIYNIIYIYINHLWKAYISTNKYRMSTHPIFAGAARAVSKPAQKTMTTRANLEPGIQGEVRRVHPWISQWTGMGKLQEKHMENQWEIPFSHNPLNIHTGKMSKVFFFFK